MIQKQGQDESNNWHVKNIQKDISIKTLKIFQSLSITYNQIILYNYLAKFKSVYKFENKKGLSKHQRIIQKPMKYDLTFHTELGYLASNIKLYCFSSK